ncbi:hypothetical protein MYP14_06180 [Rhodococcus pyridinivorans]|uniref:hypothetical protein n=1 Tax=Rhodococcus pyridinivorans TaxID=103816 RepID=UPI001FFF3B18|nr:hypothetical protein [Rhodococcus pyridinivorans]UPK64937.1 hypothetical protein MYP14_06180 [Rhodococcus pyridinivorans]
MTPDQIRLLGELADWQLLGIVDAPEYWCKHIRDSHECASARDEQWWNARLGRKTYPWGIAITTAGDYLDERKAADPAHAVTLTWRQITRWVEGLDDELRGDARRARSGTPEERAEVIDRLLGRVPAEPVELTLW